MQVTIDLVDIRHIIVRDERLKNKAENYHFHDGDRAREYLYSLLSSYEKDGFKVEEISKDSFLLIR